MSKKRRQVKKSKSARKRATSRAAAQSARGALAIATNSRKTVKERVEAMPDAILAVCDDDQGLQSMLKVLRDRNEHIKVRLAALASLQAASFSVVAFESCRSDFTATLRAVMDDPDAELRQRVLGLLMREKDGAAQKRLIAGLENPAKALVPPEKALQLLGYDPHADAYRLARKIVEDPPNETAKREALRLLGADPVPGRCSRRSCATRTRRRSIGASRPRRCRRLLPTRCKSTRARSCSTPRSRRICRRPVSRRSLSLATRPKSAVTTS